jgi:SAM-dependent methyltransferase
MGDRVSLGLSRSPIAVGPLMDWIALLARVFLAVTLLLGGISKLVHRKDWRQAPTGYGVPEQLVRPTAVLLELAAAALLVPNRTARWGAVAALGWLGLVTVTVGVRSRAVNWTTLLRNGLLVAAAGLVMWRGGAIPDVAPTISGASFTSASWIGLVVAFSALALALIEAWFILNLLAQQGRILTEVEKVQRALGITPDIIYHPTKRDAVEAMLRVANVTADDTVYDLGCGDGRIVIAAAERGARAVGIEINPERLYAARANAEAERQKVMDRVQFQKQNLFEVDIRPATVVALYLGKEINEKLRPKLFRELRPGTRVVSYDFPMGDWQPDQRVEEHQVYLWVMPADVRGAWTWHLPDGEVASARLDQSYQQVSGRVVVGQETIPITSVRLNGDSITLLLRRGEKELTYRGRVQGDSIAGTVEHASQGAQAWSAQRVGRWMAKAVKFPRAARADQGTPTS